MVAVRPTHNNKVSVIILAAGSSSRLGQSKQLVKVNGVPLLAKSVQEALWANFSSIHIVLGAHAGTHQETIQHLPVNVITHSGWEKGMGSSLKAGIEHLLQTQPETSAVVVMVCDQPLLTGTHLTALCKAYLETGKPIIASRYNSLLGVPALFDRSLFPELLKIEDNQGAKVVIERYLSWVESINWPEGSIDIDTPEDLESLNASGSK